METVYATCFDCGHVEPRPSHTWDEGDWMRCENCRSSLQPDCYFDLESAYDALEDLEEHRIIEGRAVAR